MADIWFWQKIVSPHMAGLATALAKRGHDVTYVAETEMSTIRASQGWSSHALPGVSLRLVRTEAAANEAVLQAPDGSIHICQGLRGNGYVSAVQRSLKTRGLRQWVIMESVSDSGLNGWVKRMLYRAILARRREDIDGVLALGWKTRQWVISRGMTPEKVYEFAYFLQEPDVLPASRQKTGGRYSFIFVGQFIQLKRLDLLVRSLKGIINAGSPDFTFMVVGSGPQEADLRKEAELALGENLQWVGRLPMAEVRRLMESADCLVLPSRYDGWGAVVSEALLAGTPVVASDACGSAGVVRASGYGGVFPAADSEALERLLLKEVSSGPFPNESRIRLSAWAKSIGSESGADYLSSLIDYVDGRGVRPDPPWLIQ